MSQKHRAQLDKVTLTVLSRSYCHLCSDMVLALENLQSRVDFEFHVIDIDAQTQWESEFGDKVPVLLYEDRELCHYFLDEPVVTAFLSQLR